MSFLDIHDFINNYKTLKFIKSQAAFTNYDFLNKDKLQIGDSLSIEKTLYTVKGYEGPFVILEDSYNNELSMPLLEVASCIYKGEILLKDFQKAKGEGSRGGHIVGHTKSGKPIYDTNVIKNGRQLQPDGKWHDIATGDKYHSHDSSEKVSYVDSPKDLERAKRVLKVIETQTKKEDRPKLKVAFAKFIQAKSRAVNSNEHFEHEATKRTPSKFEKDRVAARVKVASEAFDTLKSAIENSKSRR